jgi:hypothetical protein
MDVLAACLRYYETTSSPALRRYVLTTIQSHANWVLLTPNGKPDFSEMDNLYRKHGYVVRPGARSPTGRRRHYLQTEKGLIAFG